MKRILLTACLIFLPLLAPPNKQVSPIAFHSVKVFLWPEYDRRAVLVNYQVTLSADVPLPAEIRLRAPRTASFPYKISFQAWDGILYDLDFRTETNINERLVSFTVPSQIFVIEYYDSALFRNDQQRTYNFNWLADYGTDSLELTIQLPTQASQLRVKPQFGLLQVTSDNLIVYSGSLGAIPKDSLITITIQYENPTDELSQLLLPLQPGQSISLENLKDRFQDFPILPSEIQTGSGFLVGGLVLFLIVFSGIMVTLITTYRQPRVKPLKIKKKD